MQKHCYVWLYISWYKMSIITFAKDLIFVGYKNIYFNIVLLFLIDHVDFLTVLVRMILILSIIIMSICSDIWHPFCWTWKVNNHISYLFFKTGLLLTTNMFWGNYCVLTTQNTKFLITKCWLLFYNKSMILGQDNPNYCDFDFKDVSSQSS